MSSPFQIWSGNSFWEECSFYKWIFHSLLILRYCLDYHSVLLSCCLCHCVYWNQAVTANQGKMWGISWNTIFFFLVTRASSCCDLEHCHSLNSAELPHFSAARDGAGYYWRCCSVAFASRRLQHNWKKFMKKKVNNYWSEAHKSFETE